MKFWPLKDWFENTYTLSKSLIDISISQNVLCEVYSPAVPLLRWKDQQVGSLKRKRERDLKSNSKLDLTTTCFTTNSSTFPLIHVLYMMLFLFFLLISITVVRCKTSKCKPSWLPYSTYLYLDFHLFSMTKVKEHSMEIC